MRRAAVAGPSPRGARPLAWAALALAGLVVGWGVALLVFSRGFLLLLVAALIVAVVVVSAAGWWAFTTRRRWKRRLNVVLAGLVTVGALAVVGFVSVTYAGGVALLVGLTVAYSEAARRALIAGAAGGGSTARVEEPIARPWLLVNPRSGGGKAVRIALVEVARRRGVDVHELAPGDDLLALASAAAANGAGALGVAGGDGSLGAVAEVAEQAGLPFFCVPTGTRNHFAADLGLDRARPLAALDALDGHERRIDVGTVNGRVFLNNVSLGAYADLVDQPSYRDDKLGTARAVLPGILRTEQAPIDIAFQLPDGQPCTDAIVLLMANNAYAPRGGSPLQPGDRPRLDGGLLQVSVLRARTGVQLAAVLAQLASPRVGDSTSWAQWMTPAFRVESGRGEIRAAVDGEAAGFATPLDFRTLPGALRVLVPAGRRRRLVRLVPLRWSVARSLWTVVRTGRSG